MRLIYGPARTELEFSDGRLPLEFLRDFTLDNPNVREDNFKIEREFVFYDVESSTIPTGLVHAAVDWSRRRGVEPLAEGFPNWFWFPAEAKTVPMDLIPEFILRDYQCDAIAECERRHCGVVEIATGGGKTEIAIGLVMFLGFDGGNHVLFVCPNSLALEEMHDRFTSRGIATGRLGGDEGDDLSLDYTVTVATIQSLSSGLRRGSPEVVELLEECQLLLVDECHHMHARTWRTVAAHCPAPRRIGFSATPYKDRATRYCPHVLHPFDSWLVGSIGDTLIYKPARELQAQHHLAECSVIAFTTYGSWVSSEDWHTVHTEGVLENDARNLQLTTLAANLVDMGRRPLISVINKEHGRTFQKLCFHMGILSVCSYGQGTVLIPRTLAEREGLDFELIPIYDRRTRKTKKSKPKVIGHEEDFVRLGKDYKVRETVHRLVNGLPLVLIGSQLYDEVQSISCLTDLINADAGKADQRNTQKVGRILRLDGTNRVAQIWEPWDGRIHYYLKKHSRIRLETAQEQGFPIITDPGFAHFLCQRRIKDYPWRQVTVKIDRVEVKCEMCIPNTPGAADYSNIKPAVTIGAALEDGDDALAVADQLSALATYAFFREAWKAGGHIPLLSDGRTFTSHVDQFLQNCYPVPKEEA